MTSFVKHLVRSKTLVVATLLVLTAVVLRGPILRHVGQLLVVADRVEPADAIVVTVDAGAAGVLEAADLVHAQASNRVALFEDPPDEIDREFIRRGVRYENKAAEFQHLLKSLGITNVEQIPRSTSGTEGEGLLLPSWCDMHHFSKVIVITTADHSRRVQRVLHRAMRGHATQVIIRPATFSNFHADRWWQTHDGLRTGIVELQKLLLDVVRYPT